MSSGQRPRRRRGAAIEGRLLVIRRIIWLIVATLSTLYGEDGMIRRVFRLPLIAFALVAIVV